MTQTYHTTTKTEIEKELEIEKEIEIEMGTHPLDERKRS